MINQIPDLEKSSIIREKTHSMLTMAKKAIRPNSISASLIYYYRMPSASEVWRSVYVITIKSDFYFAIPIRKEKFSQSAREPVQANTLNLLDNRSK